jgi:hypothetical protein
MFPEIFLRSFSRLQELKKHFQVFKTVRCFPVGIGPDLFIPDRLQYLFGLFRIVPEGGVVRQFLFFGYQGKLLVDVKETSSRLLSLHLNP